MTHRRTLVSFLAVTALGCATARADPAKPPLAAKVKSCETSPIAAERAAVFTGSMPRGDQTRTLAMRFELYERVAGDDAFVRLSVPSFGTWERSQPNVAGFVFDKRVEQLAAAADYRVLVRFRWYANGRVVRRAQRMSPLCRQPDLRPDLRITAISVGPAAQSGQATYRVTVRNDGPGGLITPLGLSFAIGATTLPAADPVTQLAGGASAEVLFTASRCKPGGSLRAVADPQDTIEEAAEDDNVLQRACPASDDR